MARPFLIILAIAAAIMLLTALSIRSRIKRESERIRRELKDVWGKPGTVERTDEYRKALKRYSDSQTADATDEITWQDLDIDRLYDHLAVTRSSPGDAVFYNWFRHPSFDEEELGERDSLASYFGSHPEERLKGQEILSGIGRTPDRTLYDDLAAPESVSPIGTGPYAALAILTLLDLGFLFVQPVIAVFVFVGLTAFNIVLALRMKERLSPAIRGFRAALKLMKAAEEMQGLRRTAEEAAVAALVNRLDKMHEALGELAAFKRGSGLVTGRDRVADGLGEAVLQYVNLLIHLDLMKFDQMLKAYREHRKACLILFGILGELDAVCAVASDRAMLPVWCRPEFVCRDDGEASSDVSLYVKELVHPLLTSPVPVSVTLSRGTLVTGSNASGKSTFLKETGIASLMAQAIATVPAARYQAPLVRVMSSMALTDNLAGGESYYIVEIRSIRRILNALEDPVPTLVIVDEVLKGTNTIERIAASAQILKAMIRPQAVILAATHDRELTDLLDGLYVNRHFEESIEGADIRFTYELMEGPASTRNAIRLLEAEGYSEKIVEGARQMAEHFETAGEWSMA